MSFTHLLRSFISENPKTHYTYEHIKAYCEAIRMILGSKTNEKAFQSIATIFDFYGREI